MIKTLVPRGPKNADTDLRQVNELSYAKLDKELVPSIEPGTISRAQSDASDPKAGPKPLMGLG